MCWWWNGFCWRWLSFWTTTCFFVFSAIPEMEIGILSKYIYYLNSNLDWQVWQVCRPLYFIFNKNVSKNPKLFGRNPAKNVRWSFSLGWTLFENVLDSDWFWKLIQIRPILVSIFDNTVDSRFSEGISSLLSDFALMDENHFFNETFFQCLSSKIIFLLWFV